MGFLSRHYTQNSSVYMWGIDAAVLGKMRAIQSMLKLRPVVDQSTEFLTKIYKFTSRRSKLPKDLKDAPTYRAKAVGGDYYPEMT